MTLLVLNVGSSSVKYAVFSCENGTPVEIARNQSVRASTLGHTGEVDEADLTLIGRILDDTERTYGAVTAVGHRVVHGGRAFFAPVLIEPDTLAQIEDFAPLAPLHQPHNTMAIRAILLLRPDMPQVACFDTAFHRTIPELNRRLPLPESLFQQGLERYGFHGLSYSWVVRELNRVRGAVPRRTLVFHLGAGASACAMLEGRSHDTSMGFSTIDGLMMATRPGGFDPGVIPYLLEQGWELPDLVTMLYTNSGLKGVSGSTGDMKTLLGSAEPAAQRAVEMFCRRAAMTGAALSVDLGGLDAIVFTGGIGEHAPEIRARITEKLALLGATIDLARNAAADARISPDGAAVECWIVQADEERVIAEAVAELAMHPAPAT